VDFVVRGVVGLLYAYPKNKKENISEGEKKILKAMVEQIDENWRNNE
jgi:hypothetical protein